MISISYIFDICKEAGHPSNYFIQRIDVLIIISNTHKQVIIMIQQHFFFSPPPRDTGSLGFVNTIISGGFYTSSF